MISPTCAEGGEVLSPTFNLAKQGCTQSAVPGSLFGWERLGKDTGKWCQSLYVEANNNG